MHDFKKGDIVKAIKACDKNKSLIGCIGEVVNATRSGNLPIEVHWIEGNYMYPSRWCEAESLEHYKQESKDIFFRKVNRHYK